MTKYNRDTTPITGIITNPANVLTKIDKITKPPGKTTATTINSKTEIIEDTMIKIMRIIAIITMKGIMGEIMAETSLIIGISMTIGMIIVIMEGECMVEVVIMAIDGSNSTKTEGNRIRIIIRDNLLETITTTKITAEVSIITDHNNANLIRTTITIHSKKIEIIVSKTLRMKMIIM